MDGIQNIKNARKAGFENIQGYFFPRSYDGRMSAAEQMDAALNGLNEHGIEIDRLWIDIQNDNNDYWLSDKSHNQAFILELIHRAEERLPRVGIYANNNAWESVVGRDWKGASNKLLWYPYFDIKPEELPNYFKSFGGWKYPKMHQFDPNNNATCNVQLDVNWEIE
uniref:Uncharacterized protein n=1 Tax=Panagrolaimus superbus TaxID=310955 RepID=A0A914YCA1_9BILA